MSALAANKEVVEQEGKLLSMPCAASHIYKGALVKVNAAGFIAPCALEAGSQFAGIAYEEIDNSAGAAGALSVRVCRKGSFVLEGSGFAQTNVGDTVYATDDQTVTVTSATNKQIVGVISKYLSATQVLVDISVNAGVSA